MTSVVHTERDCLIAHPRRCDVHPTAVESERVKFLEGDIHVFGLRGFGGTRTHSSLSLPDAPLQIAKSTYASPRLVLRFVPQRRAGNAQMLRAGNQFRNRPIQKIANLYDTPDARHMIGGSVFRKKILTEVVTKATFDPTYGSDLDFQKFVECRPKRSMSRTAGCPTVSWLCASCLKILQGAGSPCRATPLRRTAIVSKHRRLHGTLGDVGHKYTEPGTKGDPSMR